MTNIRVALVRPKSAAPARIAAAFVAVSAAAFLALASPALAAEAPSLAGHWEGAITIPGSPLGFNIDLARKDDGTWAGDISIPLQGAKDLPLAEIGLDGKMISFVMPDVPGNPAFKGTISEDGSSISGEFTQGGQTFPFKLDRAAAPEAAAKELLAGFDEFVTKAMQDFKVPGLAMVIVKDGKPVLMKGYGLRDMKKNLPVTTSTVFAIGSSTKAFTTFVMGTLVDEGKLEWDKPVREFIPGFKMHDPVATERITPRDLVTHRSGLPRHDLLWYNAGFTRKAMVDRLAYLEPFKDLREEWHYQNLMFLTAGYLAEVITGETWEENVRERILAPLGMTHTNFTVEDSQKSPDFALPYEEKEDQIREMPFRVITNVGPAGSMNSSVEDMTQWVLVQLGGGKMGDKRIINETTLRDMHLPHMAMAIKSEHPEMPTIAYGMGWFVEPYRGHNRIHHGGNIDGFSAMVSFLPQDDIGMVALANMNGTPLDELLMRHAMDRMLGLSSIDWVGEALAKRAKGKEAEKEAEKKKEIVRKPGTKPAHDLREYAAEYEHPGYGVLEVALAGDHLEVIFNNITQPLEHWHYEVFNGTKGAKDPTFENMKFQFLTNMKGDVDAVATPFESEVKDIVFQRKPEARLSDPAYLQQFVGEYELSGQPLKVTLKGSTLVLSVPGQPDYELAPYRGTEFNFKRISTISVKFVVDPKEGVTEVQINQPEGVFTAKRKK